MDYSNRIWQSYNTMIFSYLFTMSTKKSPLHLIWKDDRLDAFIGLYFHNNKTLVALWNICKIIFSLPHGQAAVERGFSVNREVLFENLKQKSLVSQRSEQSANLREFQRYTCKVCCSFREWKKGACQNEKAKKKENWF